MATPRILIYILRRDLRLADNPIFQSLLISSQQSHHPYTHLIPLYVFSAQQLEVSGFLSSPSTPSPYPEARSAVAGFWRCGPHRAKYLAETVWDLKKSLEGVKSGLEVRVGMVGDVLSDVLKKYKEMREGGEVVDVWMTGEEGVEEKREENEVRRVAEEFNVGFKLWQDEKYFIDEYVPPPSPKPSPLLPTKASLRTHILTTSPTAATSL